MDIHDFVSQIKELAIELGKTPTKREFSERHGHRYETRASYSTLVQAAGLEPNKKMKIDNTIFEKNIISQVNEFEHTEKSPFIEIDLEHTIILGDTHFPFIHKDKLKKALDYIEYRKPKHIVQIGDLYDMLSHGKFPRSMNVYTPKEEMSEGHRLALEMWETVRKISPKSNLIQCVGNHDIRPMKRILESYPEAELFFDFSKWFKFDGVTTEMDIRKEIIIGGVAFIHGYRTKLGDHMEYMRRPTVTGHSHRGGVAFKNYGDSVLWELNAGYLGDPESKALSYTAQRHVHWTHGLGEIDEYGPRFISL